MEKINFEAGKQITPAKINEDGTITPAVWEGKTPLTPYVLNLMQTNIENAITESKVNDSSWKDLILTENFVNYNSSTKNMYRKYGNIVEVIGMVKPKTILAKGASTVCFQLPDGYRPEHQVTVICPGSEKNNWLLTINTNGNAEVARYGTTEYIDISTSTCLAYHVSFFVKAGNEINSDLEGYGDRIANLEKENRELAQQMPWDTIQDKSIHITDSAKYSKNKLEISGDMEQEKRSGKNKFKVPQNSTSNGVTLTNNADGSFTLNGTTTGVAIFSATLNKPLKTGTYTISYKSSAALGDSFFLRVRDKDNVLVNPAVPVSQVLGNNTTHNAATYTSNVESAIVAINLTKANVTYNNVVIYPQLEEGTTATNFEKYGATPSTEFPSMPVVATGVQKIKVAKNITTFPLSEDEWENGTIDGATGELSNSTTRIRMKEYKEVEANRKYLFDTVDNVKVVAIRFYNSNYNFVRMYGAGESSFLSSITAPSNAMYYKAVVKRKDDKTITTSYVKDNKLKMYKEEEITLDLKNTELCAIKENGNVVAKDRHVFRNNKWQWEKIIKKFTLKGTENWFKSSNPANISYGVSNIINDIDTSTITLETNRNFVAKAVCNYLPTVSLNTLFSNTEGFAFDMLSNGTIELRLGFGLNTEITTIALLKQWLAQKYAEGNPVTIYFILATPIYEDCTATQSEVLDKLYNNFELQKGTNNIIVESENGVGVNLELEYMQDNILKDKKLEDRVTALENLLSTTTEEVVE